VTRPDPSTYGCCGVMIMSLVGTTYAMGGCTGYPSGNQMATGMLYLALCKSTGTSSKLGQILPTAAPARAAPSSRRCVVGVAYVSHPSPGPHLVEHWHRAVGHQQLHITAWRDEGR
jgi:hypothetical protein